MGSNQGNRVEHLLGALQALPQYGVDVLRVSLLYETAPAHVRDQPAFLNAAVLAVTDLPALQLLYSLKRVEKAAGRDLSGAAPRWGPRPLDLDIVFYGSQAVDHESLTIPHSRWDERPFVRAPISDLLHPRDLEAGFITERREPGSVLTPLSSAAEAWQRECALQERRRRRAAAMGAAAGAPAGATPSPSPPSAASRPELVRVMPVHRQIWEIGSGAHIMGILNVTPDSFSDGGRHAGVAAAVEHARAMVAAGASVIDVGGQSTRPGARPVSAADEAARVLPVIRALREDSQLVHVPVSVDTYRAEVAALAVAAGADAVNDVSGGTLDAGMLRQVAALGVPYVLMHMRGTPETMQDEPHTRYAGGVVAGVAAELAARADAALAAGVLPWHLVLDPGLGFAKSQADSLELLAGLGRLRAGLPGVLARLPLMIGPSRKGFLGALTGRTQPDQRDAATVAACTAAVLQGADIVRVHDVPSVADGVVVADALRRAGLGGAGFEGDGDGEPPPGAV